MKNLLSGKANIYINKMIIIVSFFSLQQFGSMTEQKEEVKKINEEEKMRRKSQCV